MHVLSSILESILKCLLVLLGFAFAVGDETLTISYEDEDSPFVHSIERGDIGNGVWVHKDEGELPSIKHFIMALLKESLNIWTSVFVEQLFIARFDILW